MLCIIYMGNPHQLQTNHCPIWASAQQEWACVCACIRGGMFPFSLCLKHMASESECKEEGEGEERRGLQGNNEGRRKVIWEGYPTAQTSTWSILWTTAQTHRERKISFSITALKKKKKKKEHQPLLTEFWWWWQCMNVLLLHKIVNSYTK